MEWKRGLSIGGGYLLGKFIWAIIVTLEVGRLPWTWATDKQIALLFDLGTAMGVMGGLIGGLAFMIWDLYRTHA